MKLGKKAVKHDNRTLKMAKYLTPAVLPVPPTSINWAKNASDFLMYKNDQLGDCTIAGVAHMIMVWTLNASKEVKFSDDDVVSYYEKWDGYNPSDPNTDAGGIELDVLTQWQNTDFKGHKIAAYAKVDQKNLNEVKVTTDLFGGLYIGVALPISAQNQDIWDVVPHTKDNVAGSWGGHCVCVCGYDANYVYFISWGKVMKMTWAFWKVYVDESYAIISQDWLDSKGSSPVGLNLTQLQADLALIK